MGPKGVSQNRKLKPRLLNKETQFGGKNKWETRMTVGMGAVVWLPGRGPDDASSPQRERFSTTAKGNQVRCPVLVFTILGKTGRGK